MTLREDDIHLAIRDYLRKNEWQLLAGQFPDGSDDQLPTFYIRNPELARDKSPDPRRHSQGTLQLDLIAIKNSKLLIIEIKPQYSKSDERKLLKILNERREDFSKSFFKQFGLKISDFSIIPVLGFSSDSKYPNREGFTYFLVKDRVEISIRGFLNA